MSTCIFPLLWMLPAFFRILSLDCLTRTALQSYHRFLELRIVDSRFADQSDFLSRLLSISLSILIRSLRLVICLIEVNAFLLPIVGYGRLFFLFIMAGVAPLWTVRLLFDWLLQSQFWLYREKKESCLTMGRRIIQLI